MLGVEAIGISSIIFFLSHGDGVLTVLYAAWNCCSASMAFGAGRLSRVQRYLQEDLIK